MTFSAIPGEIKSSTSVFCKRKAAFHAVHNWSDTRRSAINRLPHPYCMQFGRAKGADHVEVVDDRIVI